MQKQLNEMAFIYGDRASLELANGYGAKFDIRRESEFFHATHNADGSLKTSVHKIRKYVEMGAPSHLLSNKSISKVADYDGLHAGKTKAESKLVTAIQKKKTKSKETKKVKMKKASRKHYVETKIKAVRAGDGIWCHYKRLPDDVILKAVKRFVGERVKGTTTRGKIKKRGLTAPACSEIFNFQTANNIRGVNVSSALACAWKLFFGEECEMQFLSLTYQREVNIALGEPTPCDAY